MKKISIVFPTYNEVENVAALMEAIKLSTSKLLYDFEFLFIDNQSTDGTIELLRELASLDRSIKVIVNETNFGHVRSPYHGLLQAPGDAVILMSADFQDPPHLIGDFVAQWEKGFKVVLGVKSKTSERFPMKHLRRIYYSFLNKLSEVDLIENATGSGLFDRFVIEELRGLKEPYPYFRGLVAELGFRIATVEFVQPKRAGGKSKNNLLTLLDIAILGIVNHASVTIRAITVLGFITSAGSLLVALGYLIAKLLNWDTFDFGLAPILVGVFFFGSVQVFLIGLLGEYMANILRRLKDQPLVIESERINFD